MSKQPKVKFPQRIKRGSVVVTIYRVSNPGTASKVLYQVVWTIDGVRYRKSHSDHSKAAEEAAQKADELAAGKVAMARDATAEDLAALAEARRLSGSVPLLAALQEWTAAREICGGELLSAARLWRDTHAADLDVVVVREAVRRFMEAKQKAGVDTSASYKHCLQRFVDAFGDSPMPSITKKALQAWLYAIVHPVSRNTHRKRVVALFRWCRNESILPRSVETEADRTERAQEEDLEIGILTVPQWSAILDMIRRERPEFLAVVVLAGFGGLRRSELHAQLWSDVHLDRGLLRVTSAKRNTPRKRIVHLEPAAVEWLQICARMEGAVGKLVSPPWGIDRVRTFCRESRPALPCPENAFRHSFISYRIAKTGNVAETSLEAGNSPTTCFKHYRELVSKSDGAAWFDLRPSATSAQVIELPRTA